MSKTNDFLSIFTWPVRVYFEDTDVGGVVYYANYLKYLERCRTEWLRALGIKQSILLNEMHLAFVVRKVEAEYLKPARLDDSLEIDLAITKMTRSQLFFHQRIRRVGTSSELLLTANAQVIAVNAKNMKIVSIPTSFKAQLDVVS